MVSKNKVLMFGWEFPPYNSGGLGVACAGMTRALSVTGVDVSFVLPFKVPVFASWCKFVFADEETEFTTHKELLSAMAGYNSHVIKKDVYSITTNVSKADVSSSMTERVKAYATKAGPIAKKNPHNIIHTHDWLTYLAGLEAKKVSGMPVVAHVHATEYDRAGSDNVGGEVYEIEKYGLRNADAVVTVSKRTKDVVVNKYGVDERKVKVVYNGVDSVTPSRHTSHNLSVLKDNGANIVLFVGRITLQKGPEYFVNMARKVIDFSPNTYFVVSGSGDMEQKMIYQVANLGMSSKFIFCGFLRGQELSQIYNIADIFVMPSVSEPFGIVPLEAMLSNTPVLVSKESGVSEILSNALKSNFWDIDDMADKVLSVLKHKKLQAHLSKNGKFEAQNIHWGKAADSLFSLYNSLVTSY